ncbi:hypothetical protein [Dyella sp. EPa41]|uniref:hypothetical protein n=1 Tax=Dyella sp. EPa41 TaxID=1561194 RepID=UPI00191564B1|nr:hypothetical protein [Dyella sp. EPa41]
MSALFVGALVMSAGAFQAHAAPKYAGSVIFYDINGIPVGQQISYCLGNIVHAGNVSSQYKAVLQYSCPSGFPTENDVYGPVLNYVLPPNISIEQACDFSRCPTTGPQQIPGTGWIYEPGSGL